MLDFKMRYILIALIIPFSIIGVDFSAHDHSWALRYDGNSGVATIFGAISLVILWKLRKIINPIFQSVENRSDSLLRLSLAITCLLVLVGFSHDFSNVTTRYQFKYGNTGYNFLLIVVFIAFWNIYKFYRILTDQKIKHDFTIVRKA